MIREYCRLVVFTVGLLIGVQIPAFIDQYEKRVDAHLLEAKENLSGFQKTADKKFSGNVSALIKYYKASKDAVFRSDGDSIDAIYQRYMFLQKEAAALDKSWYSVALHVLGRSGSQFFQETLNDYSYTVPLNKAAILWGVSLAFLLAFLIESLCVLAFGVIKPKPKARVTRRQPAKLS